MWRMIIIGTVALVVWGFGQLVPQSFQDRDLRDLVEAVARPNQGGDAESLAELAYLPEGSLTLTSATPPTSGTVPPEPDIGTSPALAGQSPELTVKAKPVNLGEAPALSKTEHAKLVRSLQLELRRVGCFRGAANGAWNRGTRRAAQLFMNRIAASLPTKEPDVVLLILLQKVEDRVCGKGCGPGTAPDASGRCLPEPEIASTSAASTVKIATVPALPVIGDGAAPAGSVTPIEPAAPRKVTKSAKRKPQLPSTWASVTVAEAPVPRQVLVAAATDGAGLLPEAPSAQFAEITGTPPAKTTIRALKQRKALAKRAKRPWKATRYALGGPASLRSFGLRPDRVRRGSILRKRDWSAPYQNWFGSVR